MSALCRIATAVRCHCSCGSPYPNVLSLRTQPIRLLSLRTQPIRLLSFRTQPIRHFSSTLAGRIREIPPNAYFMLVFPCITFYLGVWQVKRRKWKQNLIAELDRKQRMPGVVLPLDLTEITPDRQYERFVLEGTFDHSRETFIGPRTIIDNSGTGGGLISSGTTVGLHVVTPFKLSGRDEEILVNRGWVSRDQRKTDSIHRPTGEQKLVAVYRNSERGAGDAVYDRRTAMWSKRNVTALSDSLGTEEYFFDLTKSSDHSLTANSPIPGQTRIQLRNEHMSYIFTWFSLTVLMLLIWGNRHLSSSAVGNTVQSVANRTRNGL